MKISMVRFGLICVRGGPGYEKTRIAKLLPEHDFSSRYEGRFFPHVLPESGKNLL
jgi:hypothetical protein